MTTPAKSSLNGAKRSSPPTNPSLKYPTQDSIIANPFFQEPVSFGGGANERNTEARMFHSFRGLDEESKEELEASAGASMIPEEARSLRRKNAKLETRLEALEARFRSFTK